MSGPAPIRFVISEMRERLDCACRYPARYFLDTPGAYRMGCDRCKAFVWRANRRAA